MNEAALSGSQCSSVLAHGQEGEKVTHLTSFGAARLFVLVLGCPIFTPHEPARPYQLFLCSDNRRPFSLVESH